MTDRVPAAWLGASRARTDARALAERALRIGERTALGVLGDREAAADVAQEVAITAIRRAHALRDPAALDAWLYRVAVRASLKEARRERTRRFAERASVAGEPTARVAVEPELAAALDLLAGLPARQRASLTLRYVHDLSDAAIADAP